jgi:rubrerythrin
MANQSGMLGFESRNDVLKKYKSVGKYGWMHLIIAQRKADGKQFLRLKRYMNWFSIPDEKMLKTIQTMLLKGANELGWAYDTRKEVKIHEIGEAEDTQRTKITKKEQGEIDETLLDLLEENPEIGRRLLELNLKGQNIEYTFQLLDIANSTIFHSSERLKTAFKEVVAKIAYQDARGMQELSDLMEKWNLLQITSLTNIVRARLETIEMFEAMIHDEATYEINTDKSIHRVLEKNMWLINDSYWIAQSNRSLRTFIGEEIEKSDKEHKKKRPDFACVNHDKKLIIVEIKRPSLTLKKAELDQAELYQRIIRKYKKESYSGIEVNLVGNKISDDALEIVDLRRGIQIKTYQDFLDRCRKRYQEFLRVIES